jgi:transposase InsO family protein
MIRYLRKHGVFIGESRLRRVFKKFNLQIRPLKKFINTTDSNHKNFIYPNLLPEMVIDGSDQVWAADITYIRIDNGFVFLAVIIDLFSRKIVGWQLSKKIDGQLTLDALDMALKRRSPNQGVIHHSDRGVQYLCKDYVAKLIENNFHISCSRKGNPYDNAWTESFMKTLKDNEVYMWDYETYLDVLDRIPYFIEEVYNKKRVHSSLGYLTPEEFEKQTVGRPTFTL